MDNEEIRKLLQELKETSDGSTVVRSKVVRIHMDTPAEAQRRRRAKEREKELEEKRLAQEKARAQALEEERRLEAEKAALEAVAEAKAEAKAGFIMNLEEAEQTSEEAALVSDEETGIEELDLNWKFQKPSKAGESVKGEGGESAESSDPYEEDFDSDEADFRSGDENGDGSITGLPGRFGRMMDKGASFLGGIRKSVKEDLSKKRKNHPEDQEEEEVQEAPEEEIPEEKDSKDPVLKRRKDPAEGTWEEAEEPSDSALKAWREPPEGTREADKTREKAFADQAPSGEEKGLPETREYGPDEEWKRRMEEPPKKKTRFQRRLEAAGGLGSHLKKDRKKKTGKKSLKETGHPEPVREEEMADPEPAAEEFSGFEPENEILPGETEVQAEAAAAEDGQATLYSSTQTSDADFDGAEDGQAQEEPVIHEEGPKDSPEDNPVNHPEGSPEANPKDHPEDRQEDTSKNHPDGHPEDHREDTPEGAEKTLKRIELIDLNENQNNKEAEVIPLTGDTGPLPDPARLKKENEKKSLFRNRRRKNPERAASPKKAKPPKEVKPRKGESAFSRFLAQHWKKCLIGAAAAAVVVIAVILIMNLAGRMSDERHASVEADEGLTVRVLKQPDSFTQEGDVQISVKASETIQSITVNGENVVVSPDKSVDFMYHAAGGTLNIMAVSTDKVRSAKVILAYVDSQPPVVTIKEEDGRIALSAEDTESGLDAIYIGRTSEVSSIPKYEKYTETLEEDPEQEITYYAVDIAGNSTTPVTVALTPAESIAFERERYGLFPGAAEHVSLVTTPPNAFVNNLTLEAENPKVVQVEGDMMIRGMAEGDTKITATADGIPGVMASVSVSGHRKVTISAIGDCTLGTDASFNQDTSFNAYEAMYGDSYFFEKVKGILSSDDSTFANFEGTLTNSEDRRDTRFTFKGDPSFTQILVDGSVDVVTLANNHAHDFKEEGLADTKNALDAAGIEWCEDEHVAYQDLNGVLTAFIGIYALENGLDSMPVLKEAIADAKQHGADLIIVGFHWGVELVTEIDEFERELAHTAIDEGANLVVGTHSHLLMGIEKYNGAYIVYGLGNFCFGGNSNPTSYDSMIWQQTFTFSSDGLEEDDNIAIIPCQVSGDTTSNNYQPVPVSGDAAANIMQTIDSLSAEFGQSYSAYMVDGTLWTDSGTE